MTATLHPVAYGLAVDEQDVRILATDGVALAATLYRPETASRGVCVVFNAGGGLAIARYRRFLVHVASHGFPVLAYDYRGVGRSRPARLRGFAAGIEDWADRDQVAAIGWMRERYPHARVAGLSHSIGALIACASPAAAQLERIVLIAPHTGYWRDYAPRWRLPLAAWWHVAMPSIAHAVGFFPGRALRLGDDFPLRFARQWSGRRTPSFEVRDDAYRERATRLLANLRALALPVLAIGIVDDAFASRAGVARFAAVIPRAQVTHAELDPVRLGSGPIGHFGFFSRRHAAAWQLATDFLAPPGPRAKG